MKYLLQLLLFSFLLLGLFSCAHNKGQGYPEKASVHHGDSSKHLDKHVNCMERSHKMAHYHDANGDKEKADKHAKKAGCHCMAHLEHHAGDHAVAKASAHAMHHKKRCSKACKCMKRKSK